LIRINEKANELALSLFSFPLCLCVSVAKLGFSAAC